MKSSLNCGLRGVWVRRGGMSMVAAVLGVAGGLSASAAVYTAVDLTPGFPMPSGYHSVSNVVTGGAWQAGTGNIGSNGYALRWNGSAGTFSTLAGKAEQFALANVLGMDGITAVGTGMGIATNSNDEHALAWDVTDKSFVDLHPAGWRFSYGQGVRGTQVVGYGQGVPTGWANHALMWDLAANTTTDLHPAGGFSHSQAVATDGEHQVGNGNPADGSLPHALLWGGSREVVDLHPAGFRLTYATGVDGDRQVGIGLPVGSSNRHAMLWHGSAGSYIDLHPAVFMRSEALAVRGDWAVGHAEELLGAPSGEHAIVWNLNDLSWIDLNAFLPAGFTQGWATGIDEKGNVVGYAQHPAVSGDYLHAFIWMVPEPGALAGLGLGAAAALLWRRRR